MSGGTLSRRPPPAVEYGSLPIAAGESAELQLARLSAHVDRAAQLIIDRIPDAPAESSILALLQVGARYGQAAGWTLDGAVRALRAAWERERA